MSRRQAREVALQALFQLDLNPLNETEAPEEARVLAFDTAISSYEDEDKKLLDKENDRLFAMSLINGTRDNLEAIDEVISSVSKDWKLARMSGIDRNVLRLAIFEIKFADEPMQPGIAINEAVELSKRFGTDDSGKFVNGVLGAIIRA